MKSNAIDDELLARFLAGETSAYEEIKVNEWLEYSDANRRYFAGLREVWRHAKVQAPKTKTDAAWDKFRRRTQSGVFDTKMRSPSMVREWKKIAAVLCLLAGISWYLSNERKNANRDKNAEPKPVAVAIRDGRPDTLIRQHSVKVNNESAGALKLVRRVKTARYARGRVTRYTKLERPITINSVKADDCQDHLVYHGPKFDCNYQ